jgi:hypothetical protein
MTTVIALSKIKEIAYGEKENTDRTIKERSANLSDWRGS